MRYINKKAASLLGAVLLILLAALLSVGTLSLPHARAAPRDQGCVETTHIKFSDNPEIYEHDVPFCQVPGLVSNLRFLANVKLVCAQAGSVAAALGIILAKRPLTFLTFIKNGLYGGVLDVFPGSICLKDRYQYNSIADAIQKQSGFCQSNPANLGITYLNSLQSIQSRATQVDVDVVIKNLGCYPAGTASDGNKGLGKDGGEAGGDTSQQFDLTLSIPFDNSSSVPETDGVPPDASSVSGTDGVPPDASSIASSTDGTEDPNNTPVGAG